MTSNFFKMEKTIKKRAFLLLLFLLRALLQYYILLPFWYLSCTGRKMSVRTPVLERSASSRKDNWITPKETPSDKIKTAPSSSSKLTPKQTPVRTLKTGRDVDWQKEFWDVCRNGDVEMLPLMFSQHRDKIQINKHDYEEVPPQPMLRL